MSRRLWVTVVALPSLVLAGCPSDLGMGPGGTNAPPDDPYWCCDPDAREGCVCEGYWHCTEGQLGGKRCTQANPDLPDDGGSGPWSCEYAGETIVCTGEGSDHPDASSGGEWSCESQGSEIVCSRDSSQDDFPEDGNDTPWDCAYSAGGEMRACDQPAGDYPDSSWDCDDQPDGMTICRNDTPEQPDGGEWDCYRLEGRDVCEGDHFPPEEGLDDGGSGDWDCQASGEMVICESEGETPGGEDGGGGSAWDCAWQGGESLIVCEGEGDNPGGEGEGEGEEESCNCIQGASRYCDEDQFCLWGVQTCEERGGEREWGRCSETAIPQGCEPGGRDSADLNWEYGGGYWDGQVIDPDGDGVIRFAPDYWYNPAAQACALRQGRCVQDMWDFDRDGDIQESAGDCVDIQECAP